MRYVTFRNGAIARRSKMYLDRHLTMKYTAVTVTVTTSLSDYRKKRFRLFVSVYDLANFDVRAWLFTDHTELLLVSF
jgi:hypothetical protein